MTISAAILESLDRGQCVELLQTVSVGCVAFADGDTPAIRPVTFLCDGDAVMIWTSAEGRLATRVANEAVAFEAHELESALRSGWSVVATGIVSRVTEGASLESFRRRLQPWAPGERTVLRRRPF